MNFLPRKKKKIQSHSIVQGKVKTKLLGSDNGRKCFQVAHHFRVSPRSIFINCEQAPETVCAHSWLMASSRWLLSQRVKSQMLREYQIHLWTPRPISCQYYFILFIYSSDITIIYSFFCQVPLYLLLLFLRINK